MDTKDCVECNALRSVYKCPTCNARYCSVACCKSHKLKCLKPPGPVIDTEDVVESKTFLYPTNDTVDEQKLKLLGQNKEMINMLNDKYLRSTLLEINQQSNPEKILKQCMQRPDFEKFADLALTIVEPHEDNI